MSTDKPLRWGLLSTARINRTLIPAIRASTRSQVVAVASRDLEKARAYAAEWQIAQAFGSYEALLASPDIDVVYLSLPNNMHAEWAIKAANAGKHVLCEKPIALTVEEVDAMTAAARANKTVLAEAFMYRHHPQTLKAKALIDSGAIGDVRLLRSSFTFQIAPAHHIRLKPELGGGSVWDVGCYQISYMNYLMGGAPVEVHGAAIMGSTGVDETFAGTLRYAAGALAQFDCGFRAPFRADVEIVGSDALIRLPKPFKPTAADAILLGKASDALEPITTDCSEPLALYEVNDLEDAVFSGTPTRIPLSESRDTVRTVQALLRSAATRQPVALKEMV